VSQQKLTAPLGPHKSQAGGVCSTAASESIETSFVFSKRGNLGRIKHCSKERDPSYLPQLEPCSEKEKPLQQPSPARPPRDHPAPRDPQSSPCCGAQLLACLTPGGSRGRESNDTSTGKWTPRLDHTPSQPHGALPACPQLWGHQRDSEQDRVQLRSWAQLCGVRILSTALLPQGFSRPPPAAPQRACSGCRWGFPWLPDPRVADRDTACSLGALLGCPILPRAGPVPPGRGSRVLRRQRCPFGAHHRCTCPAEQHKSTAPISMSYQRDTLGKPSW